jgi:hypothetical protein
MVIAFLLVIIFSPSPFTQTAIFVGFVAGVTGASFSLQRRVFTAEIDEERWVRSFTGSIAPVLSIAISALFGGFAAILLFVILQSDVAAKIFNGSFIPTYKSTSILKDSILKDMVVSLDSFIHLTPSSTRSYGTHIILSFLSGFSERFLPDALDRLANSSKKK